VPRPLAAGMNEQQVEAGSIPASTWDLLGV
jgi:hypothetical protein